MKILDTFTLMTNQPWIGKGYAISEFFRWFKPDPMYEAQLSEALRKLKMDELEALIKCVDEYGKRTERQHFTPDVVAALKDYLSTFHPSATVARQS